MCTRVARPAVTTHCSYAEPISTPLPGVSEKGLSLEGFLYLHELFIDYGRMETTWTGAVPHAGRETIKPNVSDWLQLCTNQKQNDSEQSFARNIGSASLPRTHCIHTQSCASLDTTMT